MAEEGTTRDDFALWEIEVSEENVPGLPQYARCEICGAAFACTSCGHLITSESEARGQCSECGALLTEVDD